MVPSRILPVLARLPRIIAIALAIGLGSAHAYAADEIAVCPVKDLRNGSVFACGSLAFTFHSASQCVPLRTKDLDGVEDSNRDCVEVQRACLTMNGDSSASAKAFNSLCASNLSAAKSKTEAANISAGDELDTDHSQEITSIIVRPDLVSVRELDGDCVLQAAGCLRTEKNQHWLRREGRPLVEGDVLNTNSKSWPADLQALFENALHAGQGKPHGRPFPDISCSVEGSESPDRWRFEKDGISIRIIGMFDCSSNVGGGILTLSWPELQPLLRSKPLIRLTGPQAEICRHNDDTCLLD